MNIKDIAKLAKVSPSTVSKIINNKADDINENTIKRVLRIVKEYNYVPYSSVMATQSKKFIIGILLNNSISTSSFLNGILHIANQQNYTIMVFDNDGCPDKEAKNIGKLLSHNVDGVIWDPVNSKITDYIDKFEAKNIKYIFINSALNNEFHYAIDFKCIGFHATQTLIEKKHKNIAVFHLPDNYISAEIIKGFKECLFTNNIAFNNNMLLEVEGHSIDIPTDLPSAIICSDFQLAISLLETLNNHKVKIPEDLSIVSLCDSTQARYSYPKLSTVVVPNYEFGSFVCSEIIDLCEVEREPSEFITEFKLNNFDTIDLPSYLKQKKIVVVGSINIDTTFNVSELPGSGKTLNVSENILSVGGKGLNQAIGVAKLRKPVAILGKIGNDNSGNEIRHILTKNKVDTSYVEVDRNQSTGAAYIHVLDNGDSTITIVEGANKNLSPEDVHSNAKLFENSGYCLLQAEIPIETITEAAKYAKKAGAVTILKPTTLESLPNELIKFIDILIPNENEINKICPIETLNHLSNTEGISDLEQQAQYFIDKGIETIIVTRSKRGSYLRTKTESKYYPPADVTVIDSTGAADAFIAALSTYLSDGYSIDESIKVATIAAGFCISRFGVAESMIDRNTLENYLKSLRLQ